MKKLSKILEVVLSLAVLLSCTVVSQAKSSEEMISSLCGWLEKNISVAGADGKVDSYLDWTVFATMRNGNKSLVDDYKSYIGAAVKNEKLLYLSDYARLALTASAVGLDTENVGGTDLTAKILGCNFDNEVYSSSIAYALIALDSTGANTAAVRKTLKDILADSQRTDGGFNTYLAADSNASWTIGGEVDATAMVLQALAPYQNEKAIKPVVSKALAFIKTAKTENGDYESWGSANAESTAQVLAALCELGTNPLSKEYMGSKNTIIDALSTYINPDGGARCWDGSSNIMTAYQMLCGLSAYERYERGYVGLYDFSCLLPGCTCICHTAFGEKVPELAAFFCRVKGFFVRLFGGEYICCNNH